MIKPILSNFSGVMRKLIPIIILLSSSSGLAERIAVVDAGSSGSRLYFYQYKQAGQGYWPEIKLLSSKKVKPGLSSFANDPQGATQSIAKLVNYERLPADEKTASFYLLATAGMRLVSPEQQKSIYSALKEYLRMNTRFQIKQIETISGQWEGIYGWIAANYLNHTLSPGHTVGVLDMGGSSTEITYETARSTQLKLSLGDNLFIVDSQSFLGLGQDRAREQYTNDQNCFPVNYPLPNKKIGVGDVRQCLNDVAVLINQVHRVKASEANIPALMPFIAVAGYYYTAKELGINETVTPKQWLAYANQFCHKTWSQLLSEDPNNKYLANYCFNASYMNSLMINGYQFSAEKPIRLLNKINGTEPAWTLGVVLYSKVSR